jgi:hypothetical protein
MRRSIDFAHSTRETLFPGMISHIFLAVLEKLDPLATQWDHLMRPQYPARLVHTPVSLGVPAQKRLRLLEASICLVHLLLLIDAELAWATVDKEQETADNREDLEEVVLGKVLVGVVLVEL